MKKTLYLCFIALLTVTLFTSKANAQYTITGTTVYHSCLQESYYITTSATGTVSGLTLQTFFGDGTSVTNPADSGYVYFSHTFASSGTYTVKHVLWYGGSAIDSAYDMDTAVVCHVIRLTAYIDANSDCIFDAGDAPLMTPFTMRVDSAGVGVATLTATSLYYITPATTPTGTIYTLTMITPPSGLVTSCPVSGIVYDTIGTSSGNLMMGLICSSTSSGFDLGETVSIGGPGRHMADAYVEVTNSVCTPTAGTLTMTFTPKYNFTYATPTPSSVAGNVITWNFSGVSAASPIPVHAHFDVPSAWLIPGDTIHTSYVLTPITGDSDPANNTVIRIDTITGSYDPNEKSVTPQGYITAGTNLAYDIKFENTGNAPAVNIHVQDTLSDNVDITTFKLVSASAPVYTTLAKDGSGHNVVKFDFPNINLLDSSHHGNCTGIVSFTISSKPGLANGTLIDNTAGIYFDDNAVVMTNTAENIIGYPASVATMSNTSKAEVYPNPVTDELTIKVDNGTYSTMSITNILGQQMMSQHISNTTSNVSVKAFPAGVYYVTLSGASGVKVMKFEKM